MSREESLEVLQSLLNASDNRIQAVCFTGVSVIPYIIGEDFDEVYDFMDIVGEAFGVDSDKLGGFVVNDKEFIRSMRGCLYAERM